MGIRVTRQNLVALAGPGPFFVFGLLSFLALPALLWTAREALAAGAYRHPAVLAAVHVTALGFGTATALGALQQLVPVLFGTAPARPAHAPWAAGIYAAGLLSLTLGLAVLSPPLLAVGAVLLPDGVLLVLNDVRKSLGPGEAQAARRARPFLVSALIYLSATVLAGAALALNLATGWLGDGWSWVFPAHLALGIVGWFGMLILGVSYHLLPFFGLTDKKAGTRWDRHVYRLLHAGVAAAWLGGVARLSPLGALARLLWALAALLFLWDARSLFAPRARQKLQPLVVYVRIAHLYLLLLAAMLFLSVRGLAPGLIIAAGAAGICGWLANTVLGYLHRILPFYVWHNKYWDRAHEPGVPTFRRMVAQGPAWLGLAVYNAGVGGLLAALAAGLSPESPLALMGAGGLIAAGNLLRVFLR